MGLASPGKLLVVDWVPERGLGLKVLNLEQAAPLLRPSMVRRMRAALDAVADGEPRYLEFGRAR